MYVCNTCIGYVCVNTLCKLSGTFGFLSYAPNEFYYFASDKWHNISTKRYSHPSEISSRQKDKVYFKVPCDIFEILAVVLSYSSWWLYACKISKWNKNSVTWGTHYQSKMYIEVKCRFPLAMNILMSNESTMNIQ